MCRACSGFSATPAMGPDDRCYVAAHPSCAPKTLLSPIRSRMKVLKKIKRRVGLFSNRSGTVSGVNDLPPLLFHQVHGDNIRISRDGAVARRAESFCKGVTFTNRPVKISEKVYVKFLDVSNNWSGVIRFGFTCNDPSNLRHALPKYACPDLTNKAGYWAKALAERFCERDTVLFYYVTHAGDVHFGINGEEKGLFFGGVETRGQLWAMIDVYGNSTAVELLDARQQLNNSRSRCHPSGGSPGDASPDRDVDRLMGDLSLGPSPPPAPLPTAHHDPRIEDVADPRFHQPPAHFNPLPFHRTRGRNIRLSNDRCIASRTDTEFCQGYVFTSRPVQLGERIVIQVLATEPMYLGALALGLTSCDPAALRPHCDLPDDSDHLLDRPDYWVVSKDVAGCPRPGDQLAFCITHAGEVQMSKNGGPPSVLMHVDQSLTLWAFLDVYGSTQKIRILGSTQVELPRPPQAPRCSPPAVPMPAPVAMPVAAPSPGPANGARPQSQQLRVSLPEMVQLGGSLLVVNLPPPAHPYPHTQHPPPIPSATLLSTNSHTYIEPVSGDRSYASTLDAPALREWAERSVSAPAGGGGECSVCYERQIDSVLYMCGHMCMCYDCAVQQWRGKGGGHCPMCRALIRDVIRTYKS